HAESIMMRGPAASLALAILSATALGMVLMIWGGVFLWGESTPGRVVELHWQRRNDKPGCSPEIAYEVNGETHRFVSAVTTTPCGWAKGEPMTVYYRPSRPDDGYVFTFATTLPMWFFVVVGLGLAGMSLRAFLQRPGSNDEGSEPPDQPVVELADAPPDDVVGIVGTVEATGHRLTAPMSGRSCLAYEVEVRRPVFGEEGELIHRVSKAAPFLLREGSGAQAEVLAGTALAVTLDPDRRGDTEASPSKRLEQLLTEAGFDRLTARTTDNHYLWSEGVVLEGQEVVVHGCFRPEKVEGGYRAGAPRFVVEAPPEGQVVVSMQGG
ncbi:MAG: DUF3592 domain-containing protein, partial [Myxococcales bacterium]|nr:DUF3592 domain-containing protein [Myxococcales bacterium]